MICLNSIIELMGRINTMLRILRASTAGREFLRRGQDSGDALLVVLKVAQVLLAQCAVVGRNALAIVRVAAGFHLVDEVAHGQGVVLRGAENQRLSACRSAP